MNGHVNSWLGAYHDGELHGRRLQQVKAHLAHCAACRAELEQLQALGRLLQASPAAQGLTPPERFVAQVGLRLPRRPERPAWQRAAGIGWRLAPLGLLGAWAFVQAVFAVTGAVLLALELGLGGSLAARWLPATPLALGLADVFSLTEISLNDGLRIVWQLLAQGGPLGWAATWNVGFLVVIGLAYWAWLASWWARGQHRQARVALNLANVRKPSQGSQ